MNQLKLSTLAALCALAALGSACGAVSNGEEEGTGSPTPTQTPDGGLTVEDIQKGNVAENTTVTLEGLVVTAIKVGGSGVDFWAQDAGGGPQSGIYFFDQNGKTPADLAIGDEVTITGLYKEFYDLSEIVVEEAEITNTGLTPDVDAVSIADLTSAPEVWEGCLIELSDAGLTVGGAVNQYDEFPVTDGSDSLLVDDLLYDGTDSVTAGSEILYLAGVMHYAFEEWKLLPRDEDDLSLDVAPVVPATIAEIQNGTITEDTQVFDVENAVVVAVYQSSSNTRRNFWIQQGTGPNSGVLVYDTAQLLPTVAVGDTVNLRGVVYDEFKGPSGSPWAESMTEILLRDESVVEVLSSGATPQTTAISLADLLANAEAYESVLVSINDASITVKNLNPDAPSDFKEYLIGDSTNSIRVNDVLSDTRTGKTLNQALTTRIGVLEYANNAFKLEPRSATDMQ